MTICGYTVKQKSRNRPKLHPIAGKVNEKMQAVFITDILILIYTIARNRISNKT